MREREETEAERDGVVALSGGAFVGAAAHNFSAIIYLIGSSKFRADASRPPIDQRVIIIIIINHRTTRARESSFPSSAPRSRKPGLLGSGNLCLALTGVFK